MDVDRPCEPNRISKPESPDDKLAIPVWTNDLVEKLFDRIVRVEPLPEREKMDFHLSLLRSADDAMLDGLVFQYYDQVYSA